VFPALSFTDCTADVVSFQPTTTTFMSPAVCVPGKVTGTVAGATPSTGSSAPGFVVIQEWWRVNNQIKNTADGLAADGYRASLTLDLYRGKVTKSSNEANHQRANPIS
jgi:carboxymethylenebutenolidase